MYLPLILLNTTTHCTVLLAVTAITGDILVRTTNVHVYKAIFDNVTHGLIGMITWTIVSMNVRNKDALSRSFEVVLCTLISSLIDVDHFIAAKSFHLKDATNLSKRPFLHCSTIVVVILSVAVAAKYFGFSLLHETSWLFSVAFFSHHTRDATRRGYWFYPLGSTPTIPYVTYIAVTILLPYLVISVLKTSPQQMNVPKPLVA